MEADFQHFYHLDIRDFLIGADKPSRALRLIGYLPEGGAFRSVLNAQPDQARRHEAQGWQRYYGWGQTEYLLASIFSAVMATGGAKDPAYPGLPSGPTRQGRPLIPSE